MTVPSYAERARRFLAERAGVIDGDGEQSDQSDQSLLRPPPFIAFIAFFAPHPSLGRCCAAGFELRQKR